MSFLKNGIQRVILYLNVPGNEKNTQNVCTVKNIFAPAHMGVHTRTEKHLPKYNLILVHIHKWSQNQTLFLFVNLLKSC